MDLYQQEHDQTKPILIELDRMTWHEQMERAAEWMGHTLMAQIAFHQLVREALPKIQEPHIRNSFQEIEVTALDHVRKVEELFRIIQKNPNHYTQKSAMTLAKYKESISKIEGLFGGANGDWQMLHQIFLTNMNAIGAFAVTEQFGLLFGLPEIVNVVMTVVHEKETHQLVIKEYMLEMASISIIYDKSI